MELKPFTFEDTPTSRASRGGGRRRRPRTLEEAIRENHYDFSEVVRASNPMRAAHFLDWAAENYPKEYTPWNLLLKAITGVGKAPSVQSDGVKSLRTSAPRIREILFEHYSRELDVMRGAGCRATVDDLDKAKVALPKRLRRFDSSRNALTKSLSGIDARAIPDVPENKSWRDFLNRQMKDIGRTLSDDSFIKKLQPPRPVEEEANE